MFLLLRFTQYNLRAFQVKGLLIDLVVFIQRYIKDCIGYLMPKSTYITRYFNLSLQLISDTRGEGIADSYSVSVRK